MRLRLLSPMIQMRDFLLDKPGRVGGCFFNAQKLYAYTYQKEKNGCRQRGDNVQKHTVSFCYRVCLKNPVGVMRGKRCLCRMKFS